MQHRRSTILITSPPAAISVGVLVMLCLTIVPAACTIIPGSDDAEYHVVSSRPSAQVTVTNEDDRAIVEVYSDDGIGDATVSLASGSWPDSILIRFHLQGLEGFQFLYDDTVNNLSVNTQNMILQSVSIEGGDEEPVSEESDHSMAVSFADSEGTAVDRPVAGGVIEVEAPAAFLAGSYPEFTIKWIDFYR